MKIAILRDEKATTNTQLFTVEMYDVVYRGEGNANIVLSLPIHRKVLRLLKIKKFEPNESFFFFFVN